MTNKILFNLVCVKLTEQDLSELLVNNEYSLPVRFLIGGGWYRWDGTNFRGFDGSIADASPGDVNRVELIGPDEEHHEQWHVTREQLAAVRGLRDKRSENPETDPDDSRNKIDSTNPLSVGQPEGATTAEAIGTSDPRGDGLEAQKLREQQQNEPIKSEVHPGAGLSAASGPGEVVSA